MNDDLQARLSAFADKRRMNGKGPLCVALVVTRHAKRLGLPLNADALLTEAQGQVAGLGRASVQAILRDHGIDRVLAEEGGRTSRGSVGMMRAYVAFLNELHAEGVADLDAIEAWWIQRVLAFFAAKPFSLRLDPAKGLRAVVRDLLEQAEKRQRHASGTMYVGTVMQHLVGAKLDLVLTDAHHNEAAAAAERPLTHYGASVADAVSNRAADFLTGDTAIHVTTTPGESLIQKCVRNLASGLRPIIVTTERGAVVAQALAEQAGIAERIDVLDVEQFISGNLHEHGRFELDGRRDAVERLLARYNEIVDEHETDPSLRIDLEK